MLASHRFFILSVLWGPSLFWSLRRDTAESHDTSTCAQWNTMACKGSECYTCGQRITYLKGKGNNNAGQSVANEFPSQCGSCGGSGGGNTGGLGGTGGDGGGGTMSTAGYSQVWSDEFNGQSVDRSKWILADDGYGGWNNEEQYYTPRGVNAWVSGGTLKIRGKKETYKNKSYTSGKLSSKQTWTYGKFSVRARFKQATARGTWPAIWMMPRPESYGIWPRSGEIDIFEHVGHHNGQVHATIHTDAFNHKKGTQRGGSTRVNVGDWHTYSVEWREDILLFAVDNNVYQSFKRESATDTSKWPFKKPFYLILNLAIGGTWGGKQGVDEGAFTGEGQIMEVDWARVEQKGGARPSPAPRPPSTWTQPTPTWTQPTPTWTPPTPTWTQPTPTWTPPTPTWTPPTPTWTPPTPTWTPPTPTWTPPTPFPPPTWNQPKPVSPAPSPPQAGGGGCFPPTALVRVADPVVSPSSKDAERLLAELRAGDPLLSETGHLSTFLLDFHESVLDRNTSLTKYLRIEHALQKRERPLLVTANHLVFVVTGAKEAAQAVPASEVRPGHVVLVLSRDASKDSGKLVQSRVTSVGSVVLRGFAAPLSSSGTLFVEDVLVSSYALLSDAQLALWQRGPAILRENTHSVCHMLALPFRWMQALGWGSGYLSALSASFDALSAGVFLFRGSAA